MLSLVFCYTHKNHWYWRYLLCSLVQLFLEDMQTGTDFHFWTAKLWYVYSDKTSNIVFFCDMFIFVLTEAVTNLLESSMKNTMSYAAGCAKIVAYEHSCPM